MKTKPRGYFSVYRYIEDSLKVWSKKHVALFMQGYDLPYTIDTQPVNENGNVMGLESFVSKPEWETKHKPKREPVTDFDRLKHRCCW